MNMPKRASCHHCMRRERVESSEPDNFCWRSGYGFDGIGELPSAASKVGGPASATSDAPVPKSQSRRGIPFDLMPQVSWTKCAFALRLELKDSLHLQPLFPRLGFRQRLLKPPHQLLPFAYLRILRVGFGFAFERKI